MKKVTFSLTKPIKTPNGIVTATESLVFTFKELSGPRFATSTCSQYLCEGEACITIGEGGLFLGAAQDWSNRIRRKELKFPEGRNPSGHAQIVYIHHSAGERRL